MEHFFFTPKVLSKMTMLKRTVRGKTQQPSLWELYKATFREASDWQHIEEAKRNWKFLMN
jgi:hypothetical protein